MTEITVNVNNTQYRIEVLEFSSIQKMHYGTKAPNSLLERDSTVDPKDADPVTDEEVEFLIEVGAAATNFTEDDLESLPLEELIQISSAILEAAFSGDGDNQTGQKLKRVRCTEQFIECLFTNPVAVVAGMPDDASFKKVDYDPTSGAYNFIFESSEWEPMKQGEHIPYHKAYSVGFGDSSKNLSPTNLSRK